MAHPGRFVERRLAVSLRRAHCGAVREQQPHARHVPAARRHVERRRAAGVLTAYDGGARLAAAAEQLFGATQVALQGEAHNLRPARTSYESASAR